MTIIPALLHASVLGLLTAAIPLKGIATAVALALPAQGGKDGIIADPDTRQAETAESLHVLGFTSDNELLLAESEGSFTQEEWNSVLDAGQRICTRSASRDGDDAAMDDVGVDSPSVKDFIRAAMAAKVSEDLQWK